MNKRILSLIISLFIFCAVPVFPASATEEGQGPISYKGDSIQIDTTLNVPENTPVTIIVGKQGKDLDDIIAATTQTEHDDQLNALKDCVEYIGIRKTTNETINFSESVKLHSDLSTGTCNVFISYLDRPLYLLGSFYNLSRGAINAMVEDFNDTSEAEYGTLFITNETEEIDTNVELLNKLGADVTSYNALRFKTFFYKYLVANKPFEESEGISASSDLVNKFNLGIAYAELDEADKAIEPGEPDVPENILPILSRYNGTVWTLDLSPESDFYNLSSPELKTRILAYLAGESYLDSDTLEADFKEQIAVSRFLSCENALDLDEAIDDYNTEAYNLDLSLLSNEKFTDYHRTLIKNNMVKPENRNSVDTISKLRVLYTNSVNGVLQDILDAEDERENNSDDDYRSNGIGGVGISAPSKKPTDETPSAAPAFFTDVPANHWAYVNIKNLYEKKIVAGKSTTVFDPNAPVTREEIAKLVLLALGQTPGATNSVFSDVEQSSWYYEYVSAASNAGLVNGLGDGSFGVGRALTRQDATVIIERALATKGITTQGVELPFVDADDIAGYAADAVANMASLGLVQGNSNGKFLPENTISRAEICALLDRMMNILEGADINA